MIPLRLKIKGFLSYRDPVEIDFSQFSLACISGANGAGKSSLLDAMTWTLFGQARKTDDSLINTRTSDRTAEVVLEFVYESNVYRIQRSKMRDRPVRLEFFIQFKDNPALAITAQEEPTWKPLTGTSIRETQSIIEKTLRMDYETFINASFFLQGKADLFAQQRPGERKRILGSILGLDIWESYREKATAKRKETEDEVTTIDGQLREINAELSEGPARRARLVELEMDLERLAATRKAQAESVDSLRKLAQALAEQRKQVETLERMLANEKDKHDRQLDLVTSRRKEHQDYQDKLSKAAETEAAYLSWLGYRRALEQWESVAVQFRQQQEKRQAPLLAIETERGRLLQEQQSLRDQQKTAEAALSEALLLKTRHTSTQHAASQAEEKLKRRDALQEEKNNHLAAQADAKAENPRLKTEMDELKERIEELERSTSPSCPLCGQSLSASHRLELIEDLNAQGKKLADRFRQNQALLKQFENRQREMEDELLSLSQAENDLRQQNRLVDQINERLQQIDRLCSEWQAQGEPRLNEVARQLRENQFAIEAQAELASIDNELKAIGYDPQAHELVRQEEQKGRHAETDLRELETARAALVPLARELSNLEEQLAAQENEVSRQETDYLQAVHAYQESAKNLLDLKQAENELFQLQEQENRFRLDVGAARQKVEVLSVLQARQVGLGKEREEKSQRIAQLKMLERAFGKDGVPALLIEQALPEIERQANLVLERLSDGNMSVRFVTQREYKDKSREDRKETLDIQISDDAGTRDYEMFSGGEAFRVNFSIRLALSRVLAQRAGARLQTLVIDEGFGSQDSEGRQRLVEAINLVKKDFEKILVITHLDELKEAFPNRLEVEKTPRGSVVTLY